MSPNDNPCHASDVTKTHDSARTLPKAFLLRIFSQTGGGTETKQQATGAQQAHAVSIGVT